MHGISAIDVDASVKSRQTPATQMGQGGQDDLPCPDTPFEPVGPSPNEAAAGADFRRYLTEIAR
jgi:hypothetical protein